jgi:hypothetical protein
MNLTALANELKSDPLGVGYAGMTAAAIAASLNAPTRTTAVPNFCSLRTLAGVLTPDEYAAVKAAVTNAAQGSAVVADMSAFLQIPGDQSGNGGGLDFSNPAVQAMIGQLCPSNSSNALLVSANAKLAALAQTKSCSRAQQLGYNVATAVMVAMAQN